jgi:hypothetical protein
MDLEIVLPNAEFLNFVHQFESSGWNDEVKPVLSVSQPRTDSDTRWPHRSVEQFGVVFTISIVTAGLKVLAGVIKSFLEASKTQLEIRNGPKKITISGPSSSVEEILAQLQELDSQRKR